MKEFKDANLNTVEKSNLIFEISDVNMVDNYNFMQDDAIFFDLDNEIPDNFIVLSKNHRNLLIDLRARLYILKKKNFIWNNIDLYSICCSDDHSPYFNDEVEQLFIKLKNNALIIVSCEKVNIAWNKRVALLADLFSKIDDNIDYDRYISCTSECKQFKSNTNYNVYQKIMITEINFLCHCLESLKFNHLPANYISKIMNFLPVDSLKILEELLQYITFIQRKYEFITVLHERLLVKLYTKDSEKYCSKMNRINQMIKSLF